MSKKTIFYYELKRILFSRAYIILLVTAIAYSLLLIRTSVIFGIEYTAPFSEMTFKAYVSSMRLLLFLLLLPLCMRTHSANERAVMSLVAASPFSPPVFRLLRHSAIASAYTLIALFSVAFCFVFYLLVFNYVAPVALYACAVKVILLPVYLYFFCWNLIMAYTDFSGHSRLFAG